MLEAKGRESQCYHKHTRLKIEYINDGNTLAPSMMPLKSMGHNDRHFLVIIIMPGKHNITWSPTDEFAIL